MKRMFFSVAFFSYKRRHVEAFSHQSHEQLLSNVRCV